MNLIKYENFKWYNCSKDATIHIFCEFNSDLELSVNFPNLDKIERPKNLGKHLKGLVEDYCLATKDFEGKNAKCYVIGMRKFIIFPNVDNQFNTSYEEKECNIQSQPEYDTWEYDKERHKYLLTYRYNREKPFTREF